MRSIIHVTKPIKGVFKLKVVSAFFDLTKSFTDPNFTITYGAILSVEKLQKKPEDKQTDIQICFPLGYVGQIITLTTNGDQQRAETLCLMLQESFSRLPEISDAFIV